MNDSAIEAQNISFDYDGTLILDNVSFDVSSGDFVSIIGLNGCGKSTLVKLVLGQLLPNSGYIKLFGKKTADISDWTKVGYVPQNISKYVSFPATVREVVEVNLFSQIGLMRFAKSYHKKKAEEVLSLVGLSEHSKSLVSNLSGGQQQRLMIARALINEPRLLLLDEPTAGVDAESSAVFYSILQSLCAEKGITIVMVTHDTERVLEYANRIFCIEEGSLVELDKKQLKFELLHKHKHH